MNVSIGEPAYWEERYKAEMAKLHNFELFDWYCPFSELMSMIEGIVDMDAVHKVLIIGVGRSSIIDCLYRKGFRDITAIDISHTIITEMQKKYASYTGVEFFVMDTKQLIKFEDEIFTFVIDKACIDALFCGTDFIESTELAFEEIFRVLKFEGNFISISHATPLSRVPYLRAIRWAIDVYKVPSDVGERLSIYAMTKTMNEEMIERRIPGAEAAIRTKAAKVVSNLDQKMNAASTTRGGTNTGSITVTASVDAIADLVQESADVDT